MVRLLIFLAALALVAGGLTWLANNPGVVDVTRRGEQYEVSLLFALGAVLALGIAIAIVWGLLRFVFRIPSLVSVGAQSRRREKGFQALSRGMPAGRAWAGGAGGGRQGPRTTEMGWAGGSRWPSSCKRSPRSLRATAPEPSRPI